MLGQGEFFGIYPEGTRSRDGKLHRGHTGVARLALRSGCPILPVGLQGTLEVQPPDASMPRPFRMMRVRIGRPIDTARYADRAGDRMALRQITDEVMYEIRGLSGQEYVDTYATKTSENLPSAEPVKIVPDRARRGLGQRGRRAPLVGRRVASRGELSAPKSLNSFLGLWHADR